MMYLTPPLGLAWSHPTLEPGADGKKEDQVQPKQERMAVNSEGFFWLHISWWKCKVTVLHENGQIFPYHLTTE